MGPIEKAKLKSKNIHKKALKWIKLRYIGHWFLLISSANEHDRDLDLVVYIGPQQTGHLIAENAHSAALANKTETETRIRLHVLLLSSASKSTASHQCSQHRRSYRFLALHAMRSFRCDIMLADGWLVTANINSSFMAYYIQIFTVHSSYYIDDAFIYKNKKIHLIQFIVHVQVYIVRIRRRKTDWIKLQEIMILCHSSNQLHWIALHIVTTRIKVLSSVIPNIYICCGGSNCANNWVEFPRLTYLRIWFSYSIN